MLIQTLNPSTGAALKTYACLSTTELNTVLQSAADAYLVWRNTPIAQRAKQIIRVAELLLANQDQYATLIATEMGKPIDSACSEIEKCAQLCRYYASHAQAFLTPRSVETEASKSYIKYTPLGLLLAIMPWNFPFWQVFRCAVPNLLAGNGLLLKHAPIVTGCGLAIETLFHQACFPGGIFTTLVIAESQAEQVIADPRVIGVSLTGSERAGKAVASEAGKYAKKVVLELGGSDPYIILHDADLELAAKICVDSRLANSGQVCIAAKRFIVVESVKAAFQQEVIRQLNNYSMGEAVEGKIQLGPLARADLRKQLHEQIHQCVAQGATLVCGGELPMGKGFYYPITVLDHVKKGMPAYEQELFGPVIAFISAVDEATAIDMANDSPYGLGAAVFTQDITRGEKIAAEQLNAGSCFVNQAVSSDVRLPFGGTKASGFGRELAEFGLYEFMNIKTVLVR